MDHTCHTFSLILVTVHQAPGSSSDMEEIGSHISVVETELEIPNT